MIKYASIILLGFLFFLSCAEKKQEEPVKEEPVVARDLEQIVESGEIIVLTTYGATSYFVYRGQEMGYQYELAKKLAKDLKLKLNLKIVEDVNKLTEMLMNGEGDLIVYRMPVTNELKNQIAFIDEKTITTQVLVQTAGDSMVTSTIDLIGKEVYVPANSKYEDRLKNLNEELGGGIIIKTVPDSISTDLLIDMVSLKQIPFTIADNDIAALSKTYLKNIDCDLSVSFPQQSAWAVRKNSPQLLEKINEWTTIKKSKGLYHTLHNRYFKRNAYFTDMKVTLLPGRKISEYDHLFKKYAKEIPWDWQLLASMAFHESQFDTTAVSWAGAIGLMQLMPTTALMLGLEEEDMMNPEESIKAAVKYIRQLGQIFKHVENNDEKAKFILAAYNVGIGHVTDAMALSEKYGRERYLWDNNVDVYMRLKSNPDYYNDPACKFGYCRGEDASNYVKNVLERYQRYLNSGAR